MRLRDLAERLNAEIKGDDDLEIKGIASAPTATTSDLVFVEDAKYAAQAGESRAAAVIVGARTADAMAEFGKSLLLCRDPRLAFARAAELLHRARPRRANIDASAVVDPTAKLGEAVEVDAFSFVGAGAKIGSRTVIGPGCILLPGVEIGEDCHLVARVTVYPNTRIGDRAVVHAGAVLGGDGFGFVRDGETGRYEKFPQIGNLQIGNDVEIGANATIDRGALAATVIADGVKLDNMVHIAHNVQIGENVVVAAQTGISGSSVIERNVVVAGQVGIADHVRIEEGAILGAQCGVPSKKVIRGKGVVFWGTPARPLGEYLKELAVLSRLTRKKKVEE